jgi:hypothetical protein
VTGHDPFSRYFARSLVQNWTKIDPRKLRLTTLECPVQASQSRSRALDLVHDAGTSLAVLYEADARAKAGADAAGERHGTERI